MFVCASMDLKRNGMAALKIQILIESMTWIIQLNILSPGSKFWDRSKRAWELWYKILKEAVYWKTMQMQIKKNTIYWNAIITILSFTPQKLKYSNQRAI